MTVLAVAPCSSSPSPLLGAVTLIGLPFVAISSKTFSTKVRSSLAELQTERGNLTGVVEEAMSGIRAVKGFGSEALLERRLGEQADKVRSKALEVVALRTSFVPAISTVPLLELVVLNTLGGDLVLHHKLSVGMLLAFNAYVGLIAPPVQSIGGYVVLAQRAVVSSHRHPRGAAKGARYLRPSARRCLSPRDRGRSASRGSASPTPESSVCRL